MITTLLYLIMGHYVADFGLQSDYMVKAKFGSFGREQWFHVMVAHCFIHGLAVLLVTGKPGLAIAEVITHFIIDELKIRNRFGFTVDQGLHITCKVAWFVLLGHLN